MSRFSVDVRDEDECYVLIVRGEIDSEHATDLHAIGMLAISSAADGVSVVVDLSGVTFMDSTALGALVEMRNAAADLGRTVRLRRPSSRVQRILEITGMDGAFDIDDDPVGDAASVS